MQEKQLQVSLAGHDSIILKMDAQGRILSLEFRGCYDLGEVLQQWHKNYGDNLLAWPLPQGHRHVDLLLKEAILKAQDQWQFPIQQEELCHCRNVLTKRVDQAVLIGAHTPEAVARQTQASTGCGTCRPLVEKLLQFRLGS